MAVGARRAEVVVDRDHVHLAAPRPEVQHLVAGQDEVRGHRDLGRMAPERVPLLAEGGEQLAGPEAVVVQHL